MIAMPSESDVIMAEIMEFTTTVVGVAELKDVQTHIKAKAIFMAEQILHKIIMNKIVEKCVESTTPSAN